MIYDLVDPTANLIFGAVVDPSFSGQVSHLRFLILYEPLRYCSTFSSLSGKYYLNSNRLQTPRRRRRKASSGIFTSSPLTLLDSYTHFLNLYMKNAGDTSGCINGSNSKTSFFIFQWRQFHRDPRVLEEERPLSLSSPLKNSSPQELSADI